MAPLGLGVQVVEFWGSRPPGDGHVYYVLRPPWVAPDRLATFFALHPEARGAIGDGRLGGGRRGAGYASSVTGKIRIVCTRVTRACVGAVAQGA